MEHQKVTHTRIEVLHDDGSRTKNERGVSSEKTMRRNPEVFTASVASTEARGRIGANEFVQ